MSFLIDLVEKSRAIPGLPGGFLLTTRETHLFSTKKDTYGCGRSCRGLPLRPTNHGFTQKETRQSCFVLGGGHILFFPILWEHGGGTWWWNPKHSKKDTSTKGEVDRSTASAFLRQARAAALRGAGGLRGGGAAGRGAARGRPAGAAGADPAAGKPRSSALRFLFWGRFGSTQIALTSLEEARARVGRAPLVADLRIGKSRAPEKSCGVSRVQGRYCNQGSTCLFFYLEPP